MWGFAIPAGPDPWLVSCAFNVCVCVYLFDLPRCSFTRSLCCKYILNPATVSFRPGRLRIENKAVWIAYACQSQQSHRRRTTMRAVQNFHLNGLFCKICQYSQSDGKHQSCEYCHTERLQTKLQLRQVVVPVLRRRQSHVRTWLENCLHLHSHLPAHTVRCRRSAWLRTHPLSTRSRTFMPASPSLMNSIFQLPILRLSRPLPSSASARLALHPA